MGKAHFIRSFEILLKERLDQNNLFTIAANVKSRASELIG